jgi:hypothetical protein
MMRLEGADLGEEPMPRLGLSTIAIALAAGAALAGCAVTPPHETERRLGADGLPCPDVYRPLPYPMTRPDCWTDEEWDNHLDYEARRAKNGDRFSDWSYF